MIFHMYSDPSHGWLKVAKKKLEMMKVQGLISNCSFQRGDWVYLEEDMDAGIFLDAWKKAGKTVTIREHTTNKRSRLRNYDSYVRPVNFRPEDVEPFVETPETSDGFVGRDKKTGSYGLVQNPDTQEQNVKKYVGDYVAFKADTEQWGRITKVQGHGRGARFTVCNPDGFPGDYLRYDTETQVDADRCWDE